MDMKDLLSFIFVFLLVGCVSKEDTQKLTRKSNCVSYSFDKSLLTINFGDVPSYEKLDAHEIIGENYLTTNPLKIRAKYKKSALVRVEKVTNWYPTIWSSFDDNCIQFVYLFNLCYQETKELVVEDGCFLYTADFKMERGTREFFSNLDRTQLIDGIEKIPVEYEKKGATISYENSSWMTECQEWKKKADRYKKGIFVDEWNDTFNLHPYEIGLVFTFQDENGTFKKILTDKVLVGN